MYTVVIMYCMAVCIVNDLCTCHCNFHNFTPFIFHVYYARLSVITALYIVSISCGFSTTDIVYNYFYIIHLAIHLIPILFNYIQYSHS